MSTTEASAREAARAAEEAVRARLHAALPRVMRAALERPGPTTELLDALADMLGPRSATIDASERLFDPLTAPESLLPWLSGWFGWGWLFVAEDDPRRTLPLERAFPPGAERLRALLVAWPTLQCLRGRAEGLHSTLRIATGLAGIELEPDDARQHLVVRVPAVPAGWSPWLRRVVAESRPAHLSWELVVGAEGHRP